MNDAPRIVPLTCPTCGTTYDVSGLPAGAPSACPKCRTISTVPKPEAEPVEVIEVLPPEEGTPPAPPAPPPFPKAVPPRVPPPRPPEPRRTSGLAIVALVLGFIGFLVPPASLLALLFGIVALAVVRKRRGALGGGGFALAGLLCGLVSLALYTAVIVGIALPAYLHTTRTAACRARLMGIAHAMAAYEVDRGEAPPSLQDLVATRLIQEDTCRCPAAPEGPAGRYVLVPEDQFETTGLKVYDRGPHHRGTRMVVTASGDIELWPESRFLGLPPPPAEPPPQPPRPRVQRKILLQVNASGWRKDPPFDVAADLRERLAQVGIKAMDSEGPGRDASLEVTVEERRGKPYAPGGFGTDIVLRVVLRRPGQEPLLSLALGGSSPASAPLPGPDADAALRAAAVESLKGGAAYRQVEHLAGAALGLPSSLSKVTGLALLPELRDVSLELLSRASYQPANPSEQAALAAARKDFDECVSIGPAAVEPLLAVLEAESGPHRARAARALGEIGDRRAGAGLRRCLSGWSGAGSPGETEACLAVLEAIGKVGDEEALPELDRVAAAAPRKISRAASDAAEAIRERSRK